MVRGSPEQSGKDLYTITKTYSRLRLLSIVSFLSRLIDCIYEFHLKYVLDSPLPIQYDMVKRCNSWGLCSPIAARPGEPELNKYRRNFL